MNVALVTCPNCKTFLSSEYCNTREWRPCPNCARPVLVELFPAFIRGISPGTSPERIVVADQASCFFHPQTKAVIACEQCGRFLCSLCDLEIDQKHLCPTCLAPEGIPHLEQLENHRILYDSSALMLAIVPLLLWPFTIVTAPAAVFLAFYGWKKPSSVVRRTRVRLIVAMVLGILQMIAWIIVIFIILNE